MTDRESAADALRARYRAFVVARFPFAISLAQVAMENALESCGGACASSDDLHGMGVPLRDAIRHMFARSVRASLGSEDTSEEVYPGVSTVESLRESIDQLIAESIGFLEREAVRSSLTPENRIEIMKGMLLTRALDNRLKTLFSSGEVRFEGNPFQGKGFRSLGQEAIYASAIHLRRGPEYRSGEVWNGDVIAPMIRDLGALLAMSSEDETIRMVISAQMGKAGPPMNGKDLHVGDFGSGILPAAAPLAISSATIAGLAFSFKRQGSERIAISFIGEGGTSLGEWHEAINICAADSLPAVFCVQNNQTALSTPVESQTSVRTFADKAAGYGIPGLTIDGTDPDAVASAFAWASARARSGAGPTLIELVAMRMCGHAHHDDMLYLGKEPKVGWDYPDLVEGGYANRDLWDFWSERDPLVTYAARLIDEQVATEDDLEAWKSEATERVEKAATAVVESEWPSGVDAGRGVYAETEVSRVEILDQSRAAREPGEMPEVEAIITESKGATFLEGVMLGVRDALRSDERTFVYGEDVGGRYGNAFLLLRPLLEEFGDRIINSPLSEGGLLGVCIGAALAGERPIGEIQFNDFVATGFNQLVNNAAKIRYRWGGEVPMVVRMPWGGLRHAGPYHSQNTEGWFYRTPGLKILTPSTPADARAMMAAAVADPDPVLYYEHIGLYRDPRIRQKLTDAAPEPLPLGRAALRRAGMDLLIISYGAYVHRALAVADQLSSDDSVEGAVLDLRSLSPLDEETILTCARNCGRVLFVQEDAKRGSVGESIASMIGERAFDWLDAPVRVVGALDTPVPYSPPLERAYLASHDEMLTAARALLAY